MIQIRERGGGGRNLINGKKKKEKIIDSRLVAKYGAVRYQPIETFCVPFFLRSLFRTAANCILRVEGAELVLFFKKFFSLER